MWENDNEETEAGSRTGAKAGDYGPDDHFEGRNLPFETDARSSSGLSVELSAALEEFEVHVRDTANVYLWQKHPGGFQ